MRKMLLTTAVLCGAALGVPAIAQTSATPQYSDDTAAPPQPARPHHRMTHVAAASNSDTGARPGHEPGVGESLPTSNRASNIASSNPRNQVAPRLPSPTIATDGTPQMYLQYAQGALSRRQTGAAQEALERAETAYLNNPANPADPTSGPVGGAAQQTTAQARQALGRGDIAQARQLVDQALAQLGSGQSGSMASPMGAPRRAAPTGM